MSTTENVSDKKKETRREMLQIMKRMDLIEHIANKYEIGVSPSKIVDQFADIFNRQLNSTEQSIMRMRYLNEESYEQICQSTGLNYAAANNAITRARRILSSEENIECMCPEIQIESVKRLTRRNREKFLEENNLSKGMILGLSLTALELPERSRNGLKSAGIRTVNQLVDVVTRDPYAWNADISSIDARGKEEIESILYGLGVFSKQKRNSCSDKPIAKIIYLGSNGTVDDEMDYFSVSEYQHDICDAITGKVSFRTKLYSEEARKIYDSCVQRLR